MAEFNYLCAACGGHGPQIHHIDGNNTNPDPENLIPLCPNHHLRDAHNPTCPIEPGIVKLLRMYRDPAVLSPKFQPLFARLKRFQSTAAEVVDELTPKSYSMPGTDELTSPITHILPNRQLAERWEQCIWDLVRFTEVLEMGHYFRPSIYVLLMKLGGHEQGRFTDLLSTTHIKKSELATACADAAKQVEKYIMEQLRYQDWITLNDGKLR
jgi:hypothetical protein